MKFVMLIGLMGIDLWAKECSYEGQNIYSYSASIDKNSINEFSLNGQIVDNKNPGKIFVHTCKQAAENKKSLLVTLAPLEFGLEITRSSAEYAKEIRPDNCSIENNPFKKIQSFQEKLENNRKKISFINSCVDVLITHTSSKPLNIAQDKDCRITRVNNQEIIAQGGRCLMDIYPDSNFEISYRINEKCNHVNSLKELGLNPMEFLTRAVIYTLEKNNPANAQRLLIGTSLIRFNLEPLTSQGDLSADLDESLIPVYFSKYPLPEVYLGEIKTLKKMGGTALELEIFVSNRCRKLCSEGLCTSPCDYTVPLTGLFSLYAGKKKTFLKEWYDGSAVPGNFQGMIPLQNLPIESFMDGKNREDFSLEISFSDPKYDYQMFKKSLKGLLPPLPGIPTTNNFYNTLNSGFAGFSETGDINGMPGVNEIGNFTGSNVIGGLNSLETWTKGSHWPADFDLICNSEIENCKKISSHPFLKLIINFSISKQAEELKIENLSVESKSTISGNQNNLTNIVPKIKCN